MTMGRPTKYTEELADQIIDAISTTCEGTRKICARFDIDVTTVFRWIANNDDFCQRYDKAKEKQLKLIAEEISEITDDQSRDILPDGRLNSVAVARDKLRVDGRKYMLEILKPHKTEEDKEAKALDKKLSDAMDRVVKSKERDY